MATERWQPRRDPATAGRAAAGVAFTSTSTGTTRAPSPTGEAAEALGLDPRAGVQDARRRPSAASWPCASSRSATSSTCAASASARRWPTTRRAERVTGYVAGGISPLGQRKRLPTSLDETALEHETVFVSAGRRGLEIELAPGDLVALTPAQVRALS